MAKRGNGEGSVSARPRADGLGVARYTLIEDGVTRRPVLYGRTREEASRKLRAALVARDESLRAKPAPADQPHQQGDAPVSPTTKFIRIAASTPDGVRDLWLHPGAIESIEAANDNNTTIQLRSGRRLLVAQKVGDVLHVLGHDDG